MGDRLAPGVDDGGVRELSGVGARLEDRLQALIGPKRFDRILSAADDRARAVKDGVGKQLAARPAFFEAHARERRQEICAQHHDRETDDRGHARDLLGLDAQPHALPIITELPAELPRRSFPRRPGDAVCCAGSSG